MKKITADKCREQFEEWFADHSGQTVEWVKNQRASDTHYKIGPEIQTYWLTWQASRESLEIALPILEQQEKGNDGWIEWKGGLVAPVTGRVDVRYRNGKEEIGHKAGDFSWRKELGGVTIIAYRVIENDGREG